MSNLFLLQDYASLVFWVGLYCIAPLFLIIRFIGRKRKQCNILANNINKFTFSINPVFVYDILDASILLGIFFLGLVVFISVTPDIIEMQCQYKTYEYYECKYEESNPLGNSKSIIFSEIKGAKLINSRKGDFSLFNLVLNVSDVKNFDWSQLKLNRVKQILNIFIKNTKVDRFSENIEIVFPIRIERKEYRKWQSIIQNIDNFKNSFTPQSLTIRQDANSIVQEKLGRESYRDKNNFLNLGFRIICLFFFIIFSVYAIAPAIKCVASTEENIFSIKRQRFWGITTYQNEIQLDTIEGIYMVGSDDIDMMGSRLALELKSGDRVPITYLGEQSDRSKLELCDLFNKWLKSKFD